MVWTNELKQRLHSFMELTFPYGIINDNSYLYDDCMVWYFNSEHKVTLDFDYSSLEYDDSDDYICCESYADALNKIMKFAQMSNLEHIFYA